MKKSLNHKLNNLVEYYNLINVDSIYSNKAINRNNKSKNNTSMTNKKDELLKLKNMINDIKNCELKKNATKIVFADGNVDSKIMIIGEGPGAQEDYKGLPFVGQAGQLLDKMLASINLDRDKVYITNVVNFRPPSNRKPQQTEINRYYPYLKKHIEIINPKILILLGSTALNAILGFDKMISKTRGNWINKNVGYIKPFIIASFHPAFLMRQPEQKKLAWHDLKMIRDKVKELNLH